MMYKNKIKSNKNIITCCNLAPIGRFCNYFKVETGSYWGWRIIPDYEFILIVKGGFRYRTKQEDTIAAKGDIICISPLTSHHLQHLPEMGEATISCIHTEPVDLSLLEGELMLSPQPQTITRPAEYRFFERLFFEASNNFSKTDDYSSEILTSIVKTIWLGLMKYWEDSPDFTATSATVSRMREFIRENLDKKISRIELAERFGYRAEYVNYLFKKELGITPSQLINREKILYAFRLIRQDGLSVKQAAAEVGFCDQYYFSKLFKKITNRNPSEYKNSFKP